jgi:hypothetical protein
MKTVGFTSLLAAAGIGLVLSGIFGTRFWQESSSWLMIVVAFGVVGGVSIGLASTRPRTQQDTPTELLP